MKLVSLNTWGGKYFERLIKFIKDTSLTTDIYCFQEIYDTKSDIKQYKGIRANLLAELKRLLTDFQVFYDIEIAGFDENPNPVNFDLTVGKAIFIRKKIHVDISGSLLLHGNRSEKFLKTDFSNLPVTLQYLSFEINGKQFSIYNVHGIASPSNKLDTTLRTEHSRKIKEFLNNERNTRILTGDFNLLPETESIKILEKGMINLIKKYSIKGTRSNLSPFFGKSNFQEFADYTFVTNDINVLKFEVPKVEISDHLPMILKFS